MARSIQSRVAQAAKILLDESGSVTPLDVMVEIGWLPPRVVREWRRGKHESLQAWIQVAPDKVQTMHEALRQWALEHGLQAEPRPAVTRLEFNAFPLRVTEWGEKADARFDVEYVRPGAKQLEETKPNDQVVFSIVKPTRCATCARELGAGFLIMLVDGEPRCLPCLGLGHLVLLYAGNAKLTRRASKLSSVRYEVRRFSRARRRFERIGIVVEEKALDEAQAQCAAEETRR
ncbi:MAG: hypothetical protein ACOC1F_00980 [Myxococcota bacterium]